MENTKRLRHDGNFKAEVFKNSLAFSNHQYLLHYTEHACQQEPTFLSTLMGINP